jgi:putative ABC transport system permease protein
MRPRQIRPGVRRLFRLSASHGDGIRAEVDEEIRNHLALLTEKLIRQGMPHEAARREAERRFGPLDERRRDLHQLAEQRRRSRDHEEWWSGLLQDLRVATRGALRNPLLTIVAVLVLGLGIGVTTAVFSVFDSVILRPLPYRDPTRLVVVWETARTSSSDLSAGVFDNARDADEWAARSRSFVALALATWAHGAQVYRSTSGPPREVLAIPASANLFDVLGVGAERG